MYGWVWSEEGLCLEVGSAFGGLKGVAFRLVISGCLGCTARVREFAGVYCRLEPREGLLQMDFATLGVG